MALCLYYNVQVKNKSSLNFSGQGFELATRHLSLAMFPNEYVAYYRFACSTSVVATKQYDIGNDFRHLLAICGIMQLSPSKPLMC